MAKKRATSRAGMVVTTIALEPVLHRELAIAALDRQMAMTELVRQALREWLDRNSRGKGGRRNVRAD